MADAALPHAMSLVEPEAVALMSDDREDVEAIAALSAAISLKRIADLMENCLGEDARNAYGETPFQAIGAGISRALRAG